jgi:asparagine synthase (glutamine-hydrolysing)
MCGICGVWYFNGEKQVEEPLLRKMCDQLAHRGPDAAGFYWQGALGLGFRRLSILDLQTGNQPICNESGEIWTVCNGEIYNYLELRGSLAARHSFRTKSDTETIPHLYEEIGARLVERLRGMFAIAVWDGRAERLTLMVDRFGKKPLYYFLDSEKVVFASEIKALLQFPGIRLQLDYESLDEYLSCGYITAPRTIYRGVRRVCPGEMITLERDGSSKSSIYWQPSFSEPSEWDKRSVDDICAELFDVLVDSVKIRLVSDVPIGAFLSGGVDSTCVVAIMNYLGASFKTFSASFSEKLYDETDYALNAAEFFGKEHFVGAVNANAIELLPKLIEHLDEPFADSSLIPTYLVSKLARQHVSVVLSGDGGDEVFAGYHQHLYARRQQFLRSIIPSSLFPLVTRTKNSVVPNFLKLKPYLTNKPAEHWLSNGFFSARQRGLLYLQDTRQSLAGFASEEFRHELFRGLSHLDDVSQLQYHDLVRYLPGDILVKVDRASMMNSLEVRSPLLDHKLFEFVAQIPTQHRVNLWGGKLLLKRALRTILPPFTQQRQKQGFSIPQAEWINDRLVSFFNELNEVKALFDFNVVQVLFDEQQRGIANHSDRIWALICLEFWLVEHKKYLLL